MKNVSFCDFKDFGRQYKELVHGYLSLSVCIFGSIANIFNICVLRTKNMRSPTNYILTALAVADLLVMIHYIPFTIHRNLPSSPVHFSHYSYGWAIFYKFHSLFTLVLHFIACTLTIVLAVWRYVFITQVHDNKICASLKKTLLVIFATYLTCPLICFPIMSTLEIVPYAQTCSLDGFIIDREMRHKFDESELTNETIYVLHPNDPLNLSLWVYTLLLKFVPCLLLSLLSYKIISALVETRRRRTKLLNANSLLEDAKKKAKANSAQVCKDNQADRTTKMLLAVLILFLITEFPQAIMGLISALLGEVFLEECYAPLGDVMDIMALVNSSINFILYCTMSRQFRSTFQEMFHIRDIVRWFRKPSIKHIHGEDTPAETKMSLV